MGIAMKKILVDDWNGKKEMSVSQYIEQQLSSDRDGATERAQENADNSQSALARLCEILADKGILSAKDITVIACNFERDAKFIDA